MRRIKLKLTAVLSLLLCIAICLVAAFSLYFSDHKTASAYASDPSSTVSEIYSGGGQQLFDAQNLKDLYGQLVEGASDLSDLSNGITTQGKSVADKGVIVTFGGLKWIAVFLSKATTAHATPDGTTAFEEGDTIPDKGKAENDDLVLTLWLAYSKDIAQWNTGIVNDKEVKNVDYPTNMYGTSYIRSQVLNNGGKYWKTTSDLNTGTQSSSNKFAKFTMKTVANNVVDYLVAPRYIDWQYSQNASDILNFSYGGVNYDLNNEAWGVDDRSKFNYPASTTPNVTYAANNYLRGKNGYTTWKDDLVWLPSLSEVGYGNSEGGGLWELSVEQRTSVLAPQYGEATGTAEQKQTQAQKYAWTRTASWAYTTAVYLPRPLAAYLGVEENLKSIVRPAIHLNLTEADKNSSTAKPTNNAETHKYDGNEYSITIPELPKATYTPVAVNGSTSFFKDDENGKKIVAKNAGEYTVTVTPNIAWLNGGTQPSEYKLTITPTDITWDKNLFSQSQEEIYHADGAKIPLKLPSPSDENFPLKLAGKSELSDGDLTIKYIIATHKESEHDSFIKSFDIEEYKNSKYDDYWREYSSGGKAKKPDGSEIDFDVDKPLGYCVIFKVEANGELKDNFNTYYDYVSFHIFNEKLTIRLKEDNRSATLQYGEVKHTQTSLRDEIFKDIEKIFIKKEDGSEEDRTTQFMSDDEKVKFTFYYRDNEYLGQGNEYTVSDSGSFVPLPASETATYYLFVKYTGEGEEGESYITFEWEGGRPNFKVIPREISMSLNVSGSHVYGQTPPTSWITVAPSRSDGNWYASDAENNISTLNIQYKFKKSDGTGDEYTSLSADMPAGEYTVTATSGNPNYKFEATATYTVEKADLNFTISECSKTYSGENLPYETSLPESVTATYEYEGTDGTVYERSEEIPTNAGKYIVYATFTSSNPSYNAIAPKQSTLTIEKAEITYSASPSSGVYTGFPHSVGVSFILPEHGVSLTSDDYTLTITPPEGGSLDGGLPKEVGRYKLSVNLNATNASSNYVLSSDEVFYIVLAGELTRPEGENLSGVTYDGSEKSTQVSGFDGGSMSFTVTDGATFDPATGKFSATAAGDYTLTITPANDSYAWAGEGEEQITITIHIDKAALSVTADSLSITYGDTPDFTFSYSGFVSGESAESLSYAPTASSEYEVGRGVGEYDITVSAPDTLANYTVSTSGGKLTVTPKPITLKIADSGHSYGNPPNLDFSLEQPEAGVLVGSDRAVFEGIVYTVKTEGGEIVSLDEATPAGSYAITAESGVFGNYSISFENGVYTVSKGGIKAPAASEEVFVYNGSEQTYLPVGFDPESMSVENNTRTDAGVQTVTVKLLDESLVFAESGTAEITYEFEIKPAEIIVRKNGNEWFDEHIEGGQIEGEFEISFLNKDDDGNYKYILTVNNCAVEIAFDPTLHASGEGKGEYSAEVPPTIPKGTPAGRYVIYYRISDPTGNHATKEGEWRIEIVGKDEIIIVLFNKPYKVKYSFNYSEALSQDLFVAENGYITVYKYSEDEDALVEIPLEEFKSLVNVSVTEKFPNPYKNQNVGTYDITFTYKDEVPAADRKVIMYKKSNDDFDTNEDMLEIERAELTVVWREMEYELNDEGNYPINATLSGHQNFKEKDDLQLKFVIKNNNGEVLEAITEAGTYIVEAQLVDDFGNFFLSGNTATITILPKAEESPKEEGGGLPLWLIIAAIAAVVLIILIIIIVIVVKRKHAAEDYDDYEDEDEEYDDEDYDEWDDEDYDEAEDFDEEDGFDDEDYDEDGDFEDYDGSDDEDGWEE